MEQDRDSPAHFEQQRTVTDPYMQELYLLNGLPESPSLRDIEPMALQLLSGGLQTSLTGAELVLGRRLPEEELESLERHNFVNMLDREGAAAEKFALLVNMVSLEQPQEKVVDGTASIKGPIATLRTLVRTVLNKMLTNSISN